MDYLQTALHYFFGRRHFRPGQRQVIEGLLEGRDVLALWPTGAGKSLTYQLPALLSSGLTVVVSPLIALMEDQVESLQARRLPAALLSSAQEPALKEETLQKLRRGQLKLLFVAPERLLDGDFLRELAASPLNCLAVDEAHCITQWGHDFRPAYLRLGLAISHLRPRTILALTASANRSTLAAISLTLGQRDPLFSRLSLNRPNLYYQALEAPPSQRPRLALTYLRPPGARPAVVYVSRRKEAERMARYLRQAGLQAAPYHAGLPSLWRSQISTAFKKDRLEVICATVAFGMGVDKANIRQVIHLAPPASPEDYYQESGRAGRAGLPSACRLLWSPQDFYWQRGHLAGRYPTSQRLARLFLQLRTTPASQLRSQFLDFSPTIWHSVLELGPDLAASYLERLQEQALERLELMEAYCEGQACRRQLLLRAFQEERPDYCATCDYCAA